MEWAVYSRQMPKSEHVQFSSRTIQPNQVTGAPDLSLLRRRHPLKAANDRSEADGTRHGPDSTLIQLVQGRRLAGLSCKAGSANDSFWPVASSARL